MSRCQDFFSGERTFTWCSNLFQRVPTYVSAFLAGTSWSSSRTFAISFLIRCHSAASYVDICGPHWPTWPFNSMSNSKISKGNDPKQYILIHHYSFILYIYIYQSISYCQLLSSCFITSSTNISNQGLATSVDSARREISKGRNFRGTWWFNGDLVVV